MTVQTITKRILQHWKIYGTRKVFRRIREILSEYALGVMLPATPFCRALPASSRPSQNGMPEIIFLGCIEWTSRFQRPQQLCCAFTRAGCRVHYCAPASMASWGKGWYIHTVKHANDQAWHVQFLTPQRTTLNHLDQNTTVVQILAETLQRLVDTVCNGKQVLIIAEHPSWAPVLAHIQHAHIIYDCLDDFADFSHASPNIEQQENSLAILSQGIVSTAQLLADRWKDLSIPQMLIRNACDYAHFNQRPTSLYPVPADKHIIGYHGAIAEWFDVALVEAMAIACPDCTLLLVGGALPELAQRLSRLPNICLTGEIDYTDLPKYVHTFDVGILPFRIQPLTLSTNPVKIYEYLAVGLPVVAVPLPEMVQFGSFVLTGQGETFIRHVRKVLSGTNDKDERKQFARENSWDARAQDFLTLVASL